MCSRNEEEPVYVNIRVYRLEPYSVTSGNTVGFISLSYTGRERLIRTRLIRSYGEIFVYNCPNISCLKYTVNSNFHLIRSKTLLTNDFELTVSDL